MDKNRMSESIVEKLLNEKFCQNVCKKCDGKTNIKSNKEKRKITEKIIFI